MSAGPLRRAGPAAVAKKGWVRAQRWLILRRACQFGTLALFLAGPLAGWWVIKGTLASSLVLDTVPLTDPFISLQSLAAGHALETTAITGAILLTAFYAVLGGRSYCAWVCPINPVTDFARWLRQRLGLKQGLALPRAIRIWLLAAVLVVAALTGTIAWEAVNPITTLHRALLFGGFFAGTAWALVLSIFLFDLAVAPRGWCGHLCPVGEAYGLLGAYGLLRVSARRRSSCDDCMDCYQVCPEPHVITPALKGAEDGRSPLILSRDCINCGRCIDVCPQDVFAFSNRLANENTLYRG